MKFRPIVDFLIYGKSFFVLKVEFSLVFFTCDVENRNIIGVKSMELKDEIKKLRGEGLGYKKIAVCLNVSANTVKSIKFNIFVF